MQTKHHNPITIAGDLKIARTEKKIRCSRVLINRGLVGNLFDNKC